MRILQGAGPPFSHWPAHSNWSTWTTLSWTAPLSRCPRSWAHWMPSISRRRCCGTKWRAKRLWPLMTPPWRSLRAMACACWGRRPLRSLEWRHGRAGSVITASSGSSRAKSTTAGRRRSRAYRGPLGGSAGGLGAAARDCGRRSATRESTRRTNRSCSRANVVLLLRAPEEEFPRSRVFLGRALKAPQVKRTERGIEIESRQLPAHQASRRSRAADHRLAAGGLRVV